MDMNKEIRVFIEFIQKIMSNLYKVLNLIKVTHNWLILFAVLNCGFAQAQYVGYKSIGDFEGFKKQFSITSQKTLSIKSDFVQEKNLSMLSQKMISKGKFWFKKSSLIRMEYSQPQPYLMVINNSNVYIKDSKKEKKISTKSNKIFQQISTIILDCVQGTALSNPDFRVAVFENNQHYLVEMTPIPKRLAAFFKSINIIVDKKEYTVSRIEMYEKSGDNTLLSFSNRELNTTISDDLFTIH
jgi:outer membrane lipoprotein-sorting protein